MASNCVTFEFNEVGTFNSLVKLSSILKVAEDEGEDEDDECQHHPQLKFFFIKM